MECVTSMDVFRDDPKLPSLCEALSAATVIKCEDPSLAVQSEALEADINEIVRRFGLTGELPGAGVRVPLEGDFTEVFDYQSALNAVRAAQESFMELPAKIRSRFDNDPQKFHDFCIDPGNVEEALKLGLAVKLPEPEKPAEVKS